MLSDEEKKALERIDYIQDFIIENGQYNADVNDMEYFSRIVNLIEKQSKEIEELKFKNEALGDITLYNQKNNDKKWGDKIKAKIEELDGEIKVKKEIARKPMDRVSGRLLSDNIVELEKTKKVLQSLLEKE